MAANSKISAEIPVFGPLKVRVTVDLSGAFSLLAAVQGRLNETQPLFTEIGKIARRAFKVNFAEGGRPPWKALAESTVRDRQGLISAGAIPKKTKGGNVPPRLLQRDRTMGQMAFGAHTILIRKGTLRDSWCQLGSRGNVQNIEKDGALYGSQLTLDQTDERGPITSESQRGYHVLRKTEQATLKKGGSASRRIPLALIHELGSDKAHIPARPVATVGDDDVQEMADKAATWIIGEVGGVT